MSEAGFDRYYRELFGDRWPVLRDALLGEVDHHVLAAGSDRPYYLDKAGYELASMFATLPGGEILDLCAAPGGKSLVIALESTDFDRMVANDRSATRRGRLHKVLKEYLPADRLEAVSVTGHDAARWGLFEPASYDRVLADVPCSSERHVLADEHALSSWSASRPKRLAIAARGFLAAAVDSVRPGGFVMYATCALTPLENDQVVERILARRACVHPARESDLPEATAGRWLQFGEATEFGRHVLPDRDAGRGPLYACLLRKAPA